MVSISSPEITLGFQKDDLLESGRFVLLQRVPSFFRFTIARRRGSGFLLRMAKSRFPI
jgi:hypothetical protein